MIPLGVEDGVGDVLDIDPVFSLSRFEGVFSVLATSTSTPSVNLFFSLSV